MAEKKYKCSYCRMIVTVDSSAGWPDPEMGGPCSRNSSKQHSWIQI